MHGQFGIIGPTADEAEYRRLYTRHIEPRNRETKAARILTYLDRLHFSCDGCRCSIYNPCPNQPHLFRRPGRWNGWLANHRFRDISGDSGVRATDNDQEK